MTIEPNNEGWAFNDELTDGREALVYEGSSIIYRGTQAVSTTSTLHVGTPEEIDAHIATFEPTTTAPEENDETTEPTTTDE